MNQAVFCIFKISVNQNSKMSALPKSKLSIQCHILPNNSFLEVKLIKCKQYASKTYPVQSARVKILRITSGDKIHYAAFNISNLYCVGCGHCMPALSYKINLLGSNIRSTECQSFKVQMYGHQPVRWL